MLSVPAKDNARHSHDLANAKAPSPVIIAIDGPAASGKGTLARRLARRFGLKHLDTGRTYRAVAAILRARGAASDNLSAALEAAHALDLDAMATMELGSADIGEAASKVAVMAPLRAVLVERQRAFAAEAKAAGQGAVLDGRDVGTVVLPNATVKLFVTADAATRAHRRSLELHGEAAGPRYEAILHALLQRDKRDAERPVGAMRPADDAVVLDTTRMDADAAFAAAAGLVEKARPA